MQHYVMNNYSYTSQQRQQRILNDINSIIMLISAYKKSQKTTNNKKKSQSFAQKTFQIKNPKQPQISLSLKEKQYAEYGIKFQQISYSQLLYLLCRKQISNEFIESFIEEKYHIKNLSSFHEKLTQNLKQVFSKIQPQISLSTCVNENWIDIFSKQDIFDDTLDLLKSNISKNWKVNQIKTDKKLQNSILLNQGSKIFQTEPNLDDIKVNPTKIGLQIKSKQVIQESTRQILKGLNKLKREMQQCQAQMNMAKNNDNKILQKNQQYSCKKKQYNELKQIYRKRTANKQYNLIKKNQINNIKNSVFINNQSQMKDNLPQNISNINADKNTEQNQYVKKQVQVGKQLLNATQQKSKKVQQKAKEKQKSKPIEEQKSKQKDQILNKSIILKCKRQQLTTQDYDELIQILDIVNKNQQKNQRIQTLATVQTQNKKTPVKQLANNIQNSNRKQRENLINSSKQQFLDKYVKRIFNFYILEQSKMKHLSLFDKNLSGSQLNFSQTTGQSQKRKINSQLLLPSMRKKFSVQIEQSIHKESGKRRMSLINPDTKQANYSKNNKLRQRIKTLGVSLSQNQSFAFKQPQLNLESFSKFAKAFQLSNKSVSLAQILNLFKKKSHNKKSVTYNQFLQLFQLIYRLECQKMEIQFTSLMFDNYLKKQIFSWDKINKVLRLKTLGLENDISKGNTPSQFNNTNSSNHSRYKFNLVSHSGRLSEQIMQKINSSKKPIDRMPCMNRNRNSPIAFEDDLPKTRIQIKIQQIKRLKQLQKARQKEQLQTYLAESRMKENQFYQLQQDFRQQNSKSYSKRYRMMENKKRQTNQVINNFSKNNGKLINLKKLHQNNNRYIRNQSQTSNANKKYNNKNSQKSHIQSQVSNKKRQKTLQLSYQTIQSENYISQMKQIKINKQKIQTQKEIIQLQKIIGIRQSDQQSHYSQEFQQDCDYKVNQKQSRIKQNSLYQTIMHSQKLNDLDQIRKNNKKQVQSPESNYKKLSMKNKNRQQDQYLANYFSKQQNHISPIRYFRSGTQSLQNQENQSLANGRQNWRIHF